MSLHQCVGVSANVAPLVLPRLSEMLESRRDRVCFEGSAWKFKGFDPVVREGYVGLIGPRWHRHLCQSLSVPVEEWKGEIVVPRIATTVVR